MLDGIECEQAFVEFGPNPLDPVGARATSQISGTTNDLLRTQVRNGCPQTPGVYGMIDRDGMLIYVGKSKSLRKRLLSYFTPRNQQEKAGRIIAAAQRIVWEQQPSEFAALLREQQLIRRWTPRWNVQEIPRRQRPVYLCLGRLPAPYFFLAKTPPTNTLTSLGPFLGATRMQRAVDALNNYFQLRDCSNTQTLYFADQMQLFDLEHRPGCLRLEIDRCSGPCVGRCTRNDYDAQVAQAMRFLDGFHGGPVEATQHAMQRAADQRQYELASRLRDELRSLEYLYRKLLLLAQARQQFTFVYAPQSDCGGGANDPPSAANIWYLIRQSEVAEAVLAPRDADGYRALSSTLRRWKQITADGESQHAVTPFPFTLSLVSTWFRKQSDQLQRTFQPSQAGRIYRRLARQHCVAS